MTANQELRGGRIWCLACEKWWKACPCPGDFSASITITKEMLEGNTGNQLAYLEYVRSQLEGIPDD